MPDAASNGPNKSSHHQSDHSSASFTTQPTIFISSSEMLEIIAGKVAKISKGTLIYLLSSKLSGETYLTDSTGSP